MIRTGYFTLFGLLAFSLCLTDFPSHFKSIPPVEISGVKNLKNGILKLSDLPSEVNETSGLLYWNGNLLTHNDKGGEAAIFVLDTSGKLINTIEIKGVRNDDWEDIAQNDQYLFIGNFGNNEGDRRNLQILKIAKKELNLQSIQSVKPTEILSFHYPEQKDFNAGKSHNFDCEAFVCVGDKLYLFTKNRGDKGCSLYQLSTSGKNQPARKLGDFETPGRITGADISPDGRKICLTGYNKKENCFLVFLESYKGNQFFSGKRGEIDLGDYFQIGQMEGVAFKTNSTVFLSSEKTKKQPPKLYRLIR